MKNKTDKEMEGLMGKDLEREIYKRSRKITRTIEKEMIRVYCLGFSLRKRLGDKYLKK